MIARSLFMLGIMCAVMQLAGCAPEVGSERWCKNLSEKDKGDWTASEAVDYAKHCLLK